MNIRNLSRWQAASRHFAFSLLLGIVVFALFRFVWYPQALFVLAGAGTLMLLVVGIDVVIGPLLTLIVFNPLKKSLIFDLVVVVLLQLAALVYGTWVVAQSRPVFLVAVNDVLILVSANEIHPDDLARAQQPEFSELPWQGPKLVGAVPPSDPAVRESMVFESLKGGPDLQQLPHYYVPFEQISAEFVQRGKAVGELPDAKKDLREAIRTRLKRLGTEESDARVVALRARKGFGTMVMSISTGRPIFSLAIDPEVVVPAAEAPVGKPVEPADSSAKISAGRMSGPAPSFVSS